ncbi:MAG TPA: 30S ribosomal protein S16 [Candidatus Binataceae bacterium]|jgi:small subunit ribosomal protein S16|nr:30S ribosomal protein S16 [Candidatus Binataceae bacterium]
MSLVIRLRRHGSRKKPFYRIVVADSRSPRDGRFVDQVGTYDPAHNPPKVQLRKEQVEKWLRSGAQPSETVRKLIRQAASTA